MELLMGFLLLLLLLLTVGAGMILVFMSINNLIKRLYEQRDLDNSFQ